MLTATTEKALVPSKDFSVVHVRVVWWLVGCMGWLPKLGYCSLVCTWLCGFGYIYRQEGKVGEELAPN